MNPLEFSGIAQYIAETLHLPFPVITALAVALLLSWFCWRTRSTHVLMGRIWRIMYGKTATADRQIGQFIETRNRLVMFRFFSGISTIRTVAQAKRLIHWSISHDEEIADIKACGDLFDLEKCQLCMERIPGKRLQQMKVFCAFVLLLALSVTAVGVITERALLQFKDSEKWFLFSDSAAIPLWGAGILTKRSCADAVNEASATTKASSSPTGFSKAEQAVICKAFSEPDTPASIERTVAQQRYIFSILTTLLAIYTWMSWASFRRGFFATKIKNRINTEANSTSRRKARRSKTAEPPMG